MENAHHVREARDALFAALGDVGFLGDLGAFVEEHPAPAFLFSDAVSESTEYGEQLEVFCGVWDIYAPWFREYCHDLSWAMVHDRPRRTYGHPLPRPWGHIQLGFHFGELGEPDGRTFAEAVPRNAAYVGRAVWLDDSKSDVLDSLRTTLDKFWDAEIEPRRQAAGAPRRRRPLQNAVRDSRAYVVRALTRRDGAPPKETMLTAALTRMDKIWPGEGYTKLDLDTMARAMTKFGALLNARVET